MPTSAISLIQWLNKGEYRETQAVLASFADEANTDEVRIYHADVLTNIQAHDALRTWFGGGNSQYCFIGAHGVPGPTGAAIGIGASSDATEFVEWQDLWNWFAEGNLEGGLWLGACKSSDAAAALSPFLKSVYTAIPHIYGFSEPIYPAEIQQILSKLIEFTRLDDFLWLDEELAQLRAAVPDTKIELFYPASTKSGPREYMNVDDMPKKINKTFRELLEQIEESRRGQ